jgi:antitoxin HigA-1
MVIRNKAALRVHPGEVLNEEFLKPHGISADRLASAVGTPVSRIFGLLNGARRITADLAILLARAFQTTPDFWMNLQAHYDLENASSAVSAARLRRAGKLATRLRSAAKE